MWDRLMVGFLRRAVRTGQLQLTMPDGATHVIGPGGEPQVSVVLHDPNIPRRFFQNPDLTVGEAYMDGRLTIVKGDVRDLIQLALRNTLGRVVPAPFVGLTNWARRAKAWLVWNHIGPARRNVAHHYDISPELYGLFLDENRQYTCAYFRRPDMTLEEAQAAKMAHIGAKLLLQPGMRVLDIGCGFGTLAITLARDYGVRVVGITLSEVQLADARRRAVDAGLAGQVEFRLQDYRAVAEPFDRVVSVGMMEHVGRPHLATYFRKVADLLTPDGVALIHYIGRWSPPNTNSPWLNKYIFPGSYCPALSEAMRAVEKTGMILSDLEVWRGHYERTLQEWLKRFDRNVARVRQLHDERFIRMWRYYLQSAEMAFAEAQLVIHQLQLAKSRLTVPMTRDYLYPPSNA